MHKSTTDQCKHCSASKGRLRAKHKFMLHLVSNICSFITETLLWIMNGKSLIQRHLILAWMVRASRKITNLHSIYSKIWFTILQNYEVSGLQSTSSDCSKSDHNLQVFRPHGPNLQYKFSAHTPLPLAYKWCGFVCTMESLAHDRIFIKWTAKQFQETSFASFSMLQQKGVGVSRTCPVVL